MSQRVLTKITIVDEATKTLKKINKELGRQEKHVKKANTAWKKAEQIINKQYKKAIKSANKAMSSMNKRLAETNRAGKGLSKTFTVIGKVMDVSRKSGLAFGKTLGKMGLSGITRALSVMGQRMLGISEGFGRLNRGASALKQALVDLVRAGIQKAASALLNFTKSSITVFAGLEQSLAKQKVFAGIEGGMGAVSKKMKDLAQQSGTDLTQIAAAFEAIAAIGQFTDPKELNMVGDAVIKMAKATGEVDLEQVAKTLQTTLAAFSLSNDDAAKTAALLTRVANDSALSVSSIGIALQLVSANAASAGISLEETTAVLGALSNMGLTASRAGNSFNQALTKMIKPTAESQAKMDELGLTFFDSAGKLKTMETIVDEVGASLRGMENDEERLRAATELFGVRGARAMLAMVNNTQMLKDTLRSVGDVEVKDLTDQFEDMVNTTQGKLDQLNQTLQVVKANFGEAIAPAIKVAADALKEFLLKPETVVFFDKLAEALNEVMPTLIKLVTEALPILLQLLTTLMPIIGFVSDVLTQLFQILGKPEIVAAINKIIEVLIVVIGALVKAFMPIINLLLSEFLPVIADLLEIFAVLLIPIIEEFGAIMMDVLPIIIETVMTLIEAFKPFLPMIAFLARVLFRIMGDQMKIVARVALSLARIIALVLKAFEPLIPIVILLALLFEKAMAPAMWAIIKILGFMFESLNFFANAFGKWMKFVTDGIASVLKVLAKVARAAGARGLARNLEDAANAARGLGDSLSDLKLDTLDIDTELDFDTQTEMDNIQTEMDNQMIFMNGELTVDNVDVDSDSLQDAADQVVTQQLSTLTQGQREILDPSDFQPIGVFNDEDPNDPSLRQSATRTIIIEKIEIVAPEGSDPELFGQEFADSLEKQLKDRGII